MAVAAVKNNVDGERTVPSYTRWLVLNTKTTHVLQMKTNRD